MSGQIEFYKLTILRLYIHIMGERRLQSYALEVLIGNFY